MIDPDVFADEWGVLEERFNRDHSTELARRYYEILNAELDTEGFRLACRRLLRDQEFFPRPADFVEAVRGGTEVRALDEWERVADAMRGFGQPLGELGPAARKTVDLMGGITALRQTPRDRLEWVRREFLRLYGHAEEIHRREQDALPEWTPEGRKLLSSAIEEAEA